MLASVLRRFPSFAPNQRQFLRPRVRMSHHCLAQIPTLSAALYDRHFSESNRTPWKDFFARRVSRHLDDRVIPSASFCKESRMLPWRRCDLSAAPTPLSLSSSNQVRSAAHYRAQALLIQPPRRFNSSQHRCKARLATIWRRNHALLLRYDWPSLRLSLRIQDL
jgi:hypothetical protein